MDSASTDGSIALAKTFGARVIALDLKRRFTAARARNEGFEDLIETWADLKFVQFIDGDCELEQEWLSAAQAHLGQNAAISAVCGRRRERYRNATRYNALCDREWNTPIGMADSCGGDAMMRISSFIEAGGFDPEMTAHEEPELSRRLRMLGYQIVRLDHPMTIHDANIKNFRQWWNRTRRAGYGFIQAFRKDPDKLNGHAASLVRRSLMWSIGLPLFITAAIFIFGWPALTLLLVYPAQVFRLAWRNRPHGTSAFYIASMEVIAKFAETAGIALYVRDAALGSGRTSIFYK